MNNSNLSRNKNWRKHLGFLFWSGTPFGGMERRFARLAAHLIEAHPSESIILLSRAACADELRGFLPPHVRDRVLEFGGSEGKKYGELRAAVSHILQLRQLLRQNDVTNLHVCGNPGFFSFLIAVIRRKRHVDSLCMVDTTYESNSSRLSRFFGGISLLHFNKVDCLSEQPQKVLLKVFPRFLEKKYRIAPCSFTDLSLAAPQIERKYDVVTMSRFTPGKGLELIEEIPDIASEVGLHFFGSGPRPPRVPAAKVSFSGEPYSILGATKIFLSLQRINNYPSQSVLEAMASGCAIIATDVGETRKFLDDDCAVLIPYDSDALKSAIRFLMENPRLRARLGSAAQKRVHSNHTVEKYAEYFLSEINGSNHPHHHRP